MVIKETVVYAKWFRRIRDVVAKARILVRLRRISLGDFGECRNLGDGVSEIKFSFGPGYRVYYAVREEEVIILLAGGDKSTQSEDIEKAKLMAKQL